MTVALETIDPQQWARIKALAPWPSGTRITDRYGIAWITPNGGGAAAGDWVPLDDLVVSDSPLAVAPVVVTKADANLATVNTSGAWTDVDTSGTNNARGLDVVMPNVAALQWLTISPMFSLTATGAFAVLFDIATIVSGAKVHQFGTAGSGINQWAALASTAKDIVGPVSYQVQASDIENGSVRLRLQHISTGARTIQAQAGNVFRLEGRGPFG